MTGRLSVVAWALLLTHGPRSISDLAEALPSAWADSPGARAELATLAAVARPPIDDHGWFVATVRRRVGKMALDGLVWPAAEVIGDAPLVWGLTPKGRAVVDADNER